MEEENNVKTAETKRYTGTCLCYQYLFHVCVCVCKTGWPLDTGCQSEAGIVMDLDSGAVLFAQNIHVQEYPASITKLLTALVVVENASMDEQVYLFT